MKQIKFFWIAAICSIFALTSCSSDDDLSGGPAGISSEVVKTFYEMYPNATNVSWETIDDYDVAKFYDDGTRAPSNAQTNCSAWFSRISKLWGMTDREIPFETLPIAVRDSFRISIYAQSPWTVDDEANVLERANAETIYIIEVDKNENNVETDVDLYYNERGDLVQELTGAPEDNNHIDFVPQEQPMSIEEFIESRYPGARITDRDWDDGFLEIEIRHEGYEKDVYFNFHNEWVGTKWEEPRFRDIPENTWSNLWSNGYHDIDDDDIDVIDSNKGTFYAIEAERYDDDWLVIVNGNGEIVKEFPEDWDGWWGDLWDEWT